MLQRAAAPARACGHDAPVNRNRPHGVMQRLRSWEVNWQASTGALVNCAPRGAS